jgi:hypothetical protein
VYQTFVSNFIDRLFADDTSLGYASQDEAQIKYVINHDLHELGDWSKRWLMSFNPDKTEIILVGYYRIIGAFS